MAEIAATAFLHHLSLPIVALSGTGKLRWASQGACERLQPPLPVFIDRDRLRFFDNGARNEQSDLKSLFSEDRRQMLIGDVSSGNWVFVSGWHQQVGSERLLFLAFRLAVPLRTCKESGMADQFSLTKAQCAVLDCFAKLMPPKAIAEELGLTMHTVRSHLKSIHAKLGISSSTQLLQLCRAYCDA